MTHEEFLVWVKDNPRPNYHDEKVKEKVAKEVSQELGKEVFEWCDKETPLEQCISDTEAILIKCGSSEDGYGLAKEFEDEGYSPDSALVEILDSTDHYIRNAVDRLVKEWVFNNNIKPTLDISPDVTYSVRYGSKIHDGILVSAYTDEAKYGVKIPAAGIPVNGKSSALIKYEDVIGVSATKIDVPKEPTEVPGSNEPSCPHAGSVRPNDNGSCPICGGNAMPF
jgi:hypothetical protein